MPVAINGSGTITGVSVGGLPDGIVDTDMLATDAVTAAKLGAGTILQVVQTDKTNSFTTTSTSFVDVTGLSVAITPSSTSSKILVLGMIAASGANSSNMQGKVLRGSTDLIVGDAAGSRTRANFSHNTYSQETNITPMCFVYLDSPSSTSELTYKVQVRTSANSASINQTEYDSNNTAYTRCASTITAIEVSA